MFIIKIKKMPAPYPYELRVRVFNAHKRGMSVIKIKETFDVSRNTVYQWLRIKEKTGEINTKVGYHNGHSHKVKDMEEFKNFIEKNYDKTAKELADQWECKVSRTTILRYIKKIGYSYKKNIFSPQK
jgi:transposase